MKEVHTHGKNHYRRRRSGRNFRNEAGDIQDQLRSIAPQGAGSQGGEDGQGAYLRLGTTKGAG